MRATPVELAVTDTHALLWWARGEKKRLGRSARRVYEAVDEGRAVLFVPRREDYGFVTVEAFASRKAVITCADSGGPLEFVSDDRTGFVTAPEPAALAVAMARLAADKALAERLGEEAARIAAPLTWPNTIARLVVV